MNIALNRTCNHATCPRPAKARGLCRTHYQRAWRARTHEQLPWLRSVPSTGTVRRLQALVALGHLEGDLALRLGMTQANLTGLVNGHHDQVTPARRDAVDALFREMWTIQPIGWVHDRNRRLAVRNGWVGPLAWDEIDTDPEPAIVDTEEEQTKGERVLEDVEWLLDAGESPLLILTSLHRTAASIAKLADRYGRRDIARPFDALAESA